MSRPDRKKFFNLPIGHVMLGGGCGLASSACLIAGLPLTLDNSTLCVLRGDYSSKDLAVINHGDRDIYSILNFMWGFPADVDLDNESMLSLGEIGFTLQVIKCLMINKKYRGTLWYYKGELKNNSGKDQN